MKHYTQQSDIKQILKDRKAERNIEKYGMFFSGVLIGAIIFIAIHAYIISLTIK